jgi:hypothetical protein
MDNLSTYRQYLKHKEFLLSALSAIFLLFASLTINFYAGLYAVKKASLPVTDIVLSNIRVYDVDVAFVYGTITFFTILTLVCFLRPNRLPFVVKSLALFVVIRSLFVVLTHIGPFPSQILIESSILGKFTFGSDLFFSGHTGVPFLMALIFWGKPYLRGFFIASSLFFASVVLLGHLHYSIDVLSAFFITYTIYHMAEKLFKKEKRMFKDGLDVKEPISLI